MLALVVVLAACAGGPPQPPPEPLDHPIAIRVVGGEGEFFDRTTGATFVLRGGNYNRWTWVNTPARGNFVMDMLFNTLDDQLDEAAVDLDQFAAQGFNTVRVWWDACDIDLGGCAGDPAGGLRSGYLDRVTSFLQLLADRDLYVIFTINEVPDQGGYGDLLATDRGPDFQGYNVSYLTDGGRLANRALFRDLIRGLVTRGARTDRILAYELRNEPFMERNLVPFSRTSGTITTANGVTYDLAVPADHERMMNENMVDWIDDIASVIRAEDPTALVTIGYFHDMGPTADWMADPAYVVANADLDFYAHHAYPEGVLTYWEDYEAAFGLAAYPPEKPLVLGEFGVGKFTVPDPADAAMMVQEWQVSSCAYGFDGWLHWTWNTGSVDVPDLWSGQDAGGVVNAALAPAARPDPCSPGSEMLASDLLSFRRPVTASQSVPGDDAREAVDLSMHSQWTAGDGAPQWIEVDLESPRTVGGVRLPIGSITPDGDAVIEVYTRGPAPADPDTLVHTFAETLVPGVTVLEHTFDPPLADVRYVRFVVTTMKHIEGHDGWVILHEVEVRAP